MISIFQAIWQSLCSGNLAEVMWAGLAVMLAALCLVCLVSFAVNVVWMLNE